MQLKLTLTIPWAKRANDIDLHLACDVPGTVLLAVPKCQVEQLEVPEVPVRVVAGLGDFELGVKETGLQVQITYKASTSGARFHRHSRSLEVSMEMEEEQGTTPSRLCDVLLPMAAPEGHLQLQALPFGLPGAVGSHLWPSAQLLAAQLRRRYAFAPKPAPSALELGSGCGVAGLVAAAHGVQVTFSDCDPRVLPLLRANCCDFSRRTGGPDLKVIKFDFASEQDSKDLVLADGPFDLLLASDVLYEHHLVSKFFRSAKMLTTAAAEVLLAVELRPCGVDLSEAIVSEAKKCGFEAVDVTRKLKMWVTPMPPELKIPPLEERHRIFVATKQSADGLPQPVEPVPVAKRKSHQPWKDLGEKEWYQRSLHFWSKQDATDAGVLDGHLETSPLDLKESADFLEVIRQNFRHGLFATALDCGAGVGRITEGLLLREVTDAVDLLEPCGHLLQEARERLVQSKARHFLELSLQDVTELPDQYDLIWVQWVLLYLTDADLLAVLERLRGALRPNGVLIIKENCLLKSNTSGWVDDRDSSLCRSDAALQQLFAEAGLQLLAQKAQQDWPQTMLPVSCGEK